MQNVLTILTSAPTNLFFGTFLILAALFFLLALLGFADFGGDASPDIDGNNFLLIKDLKGLPLTLSFLILSGMGTIFSLIFSEVIYILKLNLLSINLLIDVINFVASFVLAYILTTKIAKFISPHLKNSGSEIRMSIKESAIGKVCKINSSYVSNDFGFATLMIEGDSFEIKVKKEENDLDEILIRDNVLIFSYDSNDNRFFVKKIK